MHQKGTVAQGTPCTTGLTNPSLAKEKARFHTDGQLGVVSSPNLHVFRVREEERVPGMNTRRHRKNMQTT